MLCYVNLMLFSADMNTIFWISTSNSLQIKGGAMARRLGGGTFEVDSFRPMPIGIMFNVKNIVRDRSPIPPPSATAYAKNQQNYVCMKE